MSRNRIRSLAMAMAAFMLAVGFATGGSANPAAQAGQQPAAAFKAPDTIDFRSANIMSEGVRMHAELFSLKTLAGKQLPTVIMAHGWGGTAAAFRSDAIGLATAGYFVVTFDYRGWGESDSRVILTSPAPAKKDGLKFTAEVLEVREVVDPLEMVTDWFNAIHWAMGEVMVDKNRIGLRGSSYSGGHVVYVAARDPRVKAIVSQVGSLDSRPKAVSLAGGEADQVKMAYDEDRKSTRLNSSH